MIEIFYNWQALVGALIGASSPVMFWLIGKSIEKTEKFKEDMIFLEKEIVIAINNLDGIKKTLESFLDIKLEILKQHIKEADQINAYAGSSAYMPKFYVHRIDFNVKNIKGANGFLDSELLNLISFSEDLILQIEDIRYQFDTTITDSKKLALEKINSSEVHNETYIRNLESFQDMVKKQIIENNFKVYLKSLTKAYVISMELRKLGRYRWRLLFSESFLFFKTAKALDDYNKNILSRMEDYIEPKFNKKFKEFYEKFSQ